MWAFFIVSMIGVLAAIFVLLRRYCADTVVMSVRISTFYAWLTSMIVVAVVPIDVFSTLNNHRPVELGYMWDVAYWSTQILTWLLLPFFQYYSEAGDFTVRARCVTSLKENGILYGAVAGAGLVGVAGVLITGQMTFESLVGWGIGLSNAFGLIVSIILLGYGLVEIPRNLWKADPERQLKWAAHRAGKYAEKVMRSTAELETVVTIIHANERQMRRHDPLRKYMDIIVAQVEKESPIKPSDLAQRSNSAGVDIESLRAEDLEYNYDKAGLAALRQRMFFAIADYKGDRAMYVEVMKHAFELEDVCKCRQLKEYSPRTPTNNPLKKANWFYKCVIKAHADRTAAVIFALLSLLIIWAEATIVSPKDISPLSLMIQGSEGSEFGIQLLTLLPLAYICACCYAALFSINAFNYNKLIPGATIGSSLMQNGTLMCRFAAPTCWNFYHMIRMTSTKKGERTMFTDKMGSMDVPEVLRSHLNTYLPLILVIECLITLFNLWDRIMGCCVSSKYKFSNTDDVDDDYTEKGRALIGREREAAIKGFPIGQVLTTAFFDLDFPDIGGPRSRAVQQKKGFMGFFGRKQQAPPPELAAPSRPAMASGGAAAGAGAAPPTKFKSATAAAAAARWLGRGDGLPADAFASSSSAVPGPLDTTSHKASLLASRYDQSPPSEPSGAAAAGGGGKSGLDGIFATLGTGGARAGGAAVGGRRPGDPPTAADAAPSHSEKDSLLGGLWGRS